MGDHINIAADSAARTTTTWVGRNHFDLTVVALGAVLTLRFWSILFGVSDARVVTVLAAAAICEIGRSVMISRRRRERPQFVCADRRCDLLAAIALATAPWPITLPMSAASALWSMCLPAGEIRPLVAVAVLLVAVRRLSSAAAHGVTG